MILRIFGSKGISFSTQEIGRKMIFFYYLRNLHDVIRNKKDDLSVLKKGDKITFSLVSNAMLTGYQKVLVLKSSEMENRVFFRAKKLMKRWYFTEHWKVPLLDFLKMGNRSFCEPKIWWEDDIYWSMESSGFEIFGDGKYGLLWAWKLMEIWYLLTTEKFLFWGFRWWEIQCFFQQKSW